MAATWGWRVRRGSRHNADRRLWPPAEKIIMTSAEYLLPRAGAGRNCSKDLILSAASAARKMGIRTTRSVAGPADTAPTAPGAPTVTLSRAALVQLISGEKTLEASLAEGAVGLDGLGERLAPF